MKEFGKGNLDSRLLTMLKESKCIPKAIELAQAWSEEASELLHSINPRNDEAMEKVLHFVDCDTLTVIEACRSAYAQ